MNLWDKFMFEFFNEELLILLVLFWLVMLYIVLLEDNFGIYLLFFILIKLFLLEKVVIVSWVIGIIVLFE